MTQRRAIPRGGLTVSSVRPPSRVRRVLVWAGRIGTGVAFLAALAGVCVVLLPEDDRDQPAAATRTAATAKRLPAAPRVVFDGVPSSMRAPAANPELGAEGVASLAPSARSLPAAASRDPSGLTRSLLAMDRSSAQERMRRLLAEAGNDGLKRAELLRVDRALGLRAVPRPQRAAAGATAVTSGGSPEQTLGDVSLPLAARSAAAWQLAAQEEIGLEALLQATASREPSTRRLAAEALSRRASDPRAQNVLVAMQQDPEQQVRVAASKALARNTRGQRHSRRRRGARARQG